MINALDAWLAFHENTPMVLTRGAQLCRVIEVHENARECLVQTESGKRLNRDWSDLYPTAILQGIVQRFQGGSDVERPAYNGGTLVTAIPMNAEHLEAGYAVVIVLRGEYVGFRADKLGEPTWGNGHYFMQRADAAMNWALDYAGLRKATS